MQPFWLHENTNSSTIPTFPQELGFSQLRPAKCKPVLVGARARHEGLSDLEGVQMFKKHTQVEASLDLQSVHTCKPKHDILLI